MDTNIMMNVGGDQSSAVPTMVPNSTAITLVDSSIYKPDELVFPTGGSSQTRKCLHHNLLNFGRNIVEIGHQGIVYQQTPVMSSSSSADVTQTSLLSVALTGSSGGGGSPMVMSNGSPTIVDVGGRPQQARYMRVGPSNAIKTDPNSNKMILTTSVGGGASVVPNVMVVGGGGVGSVSQANTNVQAVSATTMTSNSNNSDTVSKGYGGLLAKRYLILDLYDGNNLHRCFDVRSREEFVCMVR